MSVASANAAPQMQHHAVRDLAAPEIVNQENFRGVDIAASPTMNHSVLPVEPMSKAEPPGAAAAAAHRRGSRSWRGRFWRR